MVPYILLCGLDRISGRSDTINHIRRQFSTGSDDRAGRSAFAQLPHGDGTYGSDVRRDDNIGQAAKGVIQGKWFRVEDIEGGRSDMFAFKGANERGGVHEIAACDIDEEGPGFHFRK